MIYALIALAVALIGAFLASGAVAADIKERELIPLTAVFLGAAIGLVIGLISAPVYGVILGLGSALVLLLLWIRRFAPGQVMVFQPTLGREENAINSSEWLLMFPGDRLFWESVCEHIATIELAPIVISGHEANAAVRFREGEATVSFRLEASPPIDLPDERNNKTSMLARFVMAIPSGTALTDSATRTEHVRSVCLTLAKRMLESTVANLSAFEANAGQLDQMIRVSSQINGQSQLEQFSNELENRVGLPRELLIFSIEGIDMGASLRRTWEKKVSNDSIREKAIELLQTSSIPPPRVYRRLLRDEQKRDAMKFERMSSSSQVSYDMEVNSCRAELDALLTPEAYELMLNSDKSTPPLQKADAIMQHRKKFAGAQVALFGAIEREQQYRHQAIEMERSNAAAENAAPSIFQDSPERIQLADRLLDKLQEYQLLYSRVLERAVDQTAAANSTTRISVAGIEHLGQAQGLDALRKLGNRR